MFSRSSTRILPFSSDVSGGRSVSIPVTPPMLPCPRRLWLAELHGPLRIRHPEAFDGRRRGGVLLNAGAGGDEERHEAVDGPVSVARRPALTAAVHHRADVAPGHRLG